MSKGHPKNAAFIFTATIKVIFEEKHSLDAYASAPSESITAFGCWYIRARELYSQPQKAFGAALSVF